MATGTVGHAVWGGGGGGGGGEDSEIIWTVQVSVWWNSFVGKTLQKIAYRSSFTLELVVTGPSLVAVSYNILLSYRCRRQQRVDLATPFRTKSS